MAQRGDLTTRNADTGNAESFFGASGRQARESGPREKVSIVAWPVQRLAKTLRQGSEARVAPLGFDIWLSWRRVYHANRGYQSGFRLFSGYRRSWIVRAGSPRSGVCIVRAGWKDAGR